MSSKYPLSFIKVINYKGITSVNTIQNLLNQFFMEHNYDRFDEKNTFLTTKTGRYIEIETMYEKQYSDDDFFQLKIELTCQHVKPVKMKVNGKEQDDLVSADIELRFVPFLRVDGNGKWSGSAIKVFFQYLATFFIFKHHFDEFKKDGEIDANTIYEKILHYLNGSNKL